MVKEVFTALQAELKNVGESMSTIKKHMDQHFSSTDSEIYTQDMTSSFREMFGCQNMTTCQEMRDEYYDVGIELYWTKRKKSAKRRFCDFEITVYDGKESLTYYVHKSILTFGPRRCEYFVRMLDPSERENQKESTIEQDLDNRNNCEVYLPSSAAQVMPQLLDYLYNKEMRHLDSSIAPALAFVAKFFDVRELYKFVTDFIETDIDIPQNTPTYCIEANKLHDKELLNKAITNCAKTFFVSKVWIALTPNLFYQVLSSPSMISRGKEELVGANIAHYLREYEGEITDENFFFLTHFEILPIIPSNEAMFFLRYVQQNFPDFLTSSVEFENGEESSLRQRCIKACAKSWSTTLVKPITQKLGAQQQLSGSSDGPSFYQTLPVDLKLEMLELAILKAHKDNSSLQICDQPKYINDSTNQKQSADRDFEYRSPYNRKRMDF